MRYVWNALNAIVIFVNCCHISAHGRFFLGGGIGGNSLSSSVDTCEDGRTNIRNFKLSQHGIAGILFGGYEHAFSNLVLGLDTQVGASNAKGKDYATVEALPGHICTVTTTLQEKSSAAFSLAMTLFLNQRFGLYTRAGVRLSSFELSYYRQKQAQPDIKFTKKHAIWGAEPTLGITYKTSKDSQVFLEGTYTFYKRSKKFRDSRVSQDFYYAHQPKISRVVLGFKYLLGK